MDIKQLMNGIINASKPANAMKPDKTVTARNNRVLAQKRGSDRVAAKAAAANQQRYKPK